MYFKVKTKKVIYIGNKIFIIRMEILFMIAKDIR